MSPKMTLSIIHLCYQLTSESRFTEANNTATTRKEKSCNYYKCLNLLNTIKVFLLERGKNPKRFLYEALTIIRKRLSLVNLLLAFFKWMYSSNYKSMFFNIQKNKLEEKKKRLKHKDLPTSDKSTLLLYASPLDIRGVVKIWVWQVWVIDLDLNFWIPEKSCADPHISSTGIGCPGKWWNPNPWRNLKDV